MIRALKWIAATLGLLMFLPVVYLIAISFGPYQKVAGELRTAPEESTSSLAAQAVLVAEDPDFLESSRIETLKRIGQMLTYTPGEKLKGATISGQLVRNLLLTNDRRHQLAELGTTVAVDALWPKAQVLAAYLRVVHLGAKNGVPIVGFESGAGAYFGKPLGSLSIAETALLAALVKGPSFYSPAEHPDRAMERRAKVLEAMKQSRIITEQELNEALKAPLPKEA